MKRRTILVFIVMFEGGKQGVSSSHWGDVFPLSVGLCTLHSLAMDGTTLMDQNVCMFVER